MFLSPPSRPGQPLTELQPPRWVVPLWSSAHTESCSETLCVNVFPEATWRGSSRNSCSGRPRRAEAPTARDRRQRQRRPEQLRPLKEGPARLQRRRPRGVDAEECFPFSPGAGPYICVLVISANCCWGHETALCLSEGDFARVQHSQGVRRNKAREACPPGRPLPLPVKGPECTSLAHASAAKITCKSGLDPF